MSRPHDSGNKYTRGHALVSGGYPMTGAARMAARAAARSGAGLTTVPVSAAGLPVDAAALTGVMVRELEEPGAFAAFIADRRISGMLIGPGAGVGEAARERTLAMLATGRPVVIDADAFTSFQGDPSSLDRAVKGACVLTPHDGVFDVVGDRLSRARKAARRSGAIMLQKGGDTVVVAPDGRAVINSNAPPTLATEGSATCSAGSCWACWHRAMDPFLAAAGVWLHGPAAASFSPGLLAEDLPDLLPGVFRTIFELPPGMVSA